MSFFKNLSNSILNINAEPSPAEPPAPPGDDPILVALLHGNQITRDMALSIPKVSESVRKITDIVGMVPFNLYRKSRTGADKLSVEEVKDDYRLNLINSDTGDTLDAVQFKKAMVKDYLFGRGGYAYVNSRGGLFRSLHYVQEDQLSFFSNNDPIFKSYSISIAGHRYQDYEIMKILRNTTNGYSGTGILSEINKALESAYSALLAQLKMTKTGGVKKGFILAEKGLEGDALKKLKQAWQQMYSSDSENIVVLTKNLKFQEASMTALDMQLASIRKSLNEDIRGAFGIEDKNDDFIEFTILPILTAIETALDRYLLLEEEKDSMYWKADTRKIDKAANESRTKVSTINEQRYHEDLPEVEGLDLLQLSLGSTFFDTKKEQFYTPNTGQSGSASSSKGGEN